MGSVLAWLLQNNGTSSIEINIDIGIDMEIYKEIYYRESAPVYYWVRFTIRKWLRL